MATSAAAMSASPAGGRSKPAEAAACSRSHASIRGHPLRIATHAEHPIDRNRHNHAHRRQQPSRHSLTTPHRLRKGEGPPTQRVRTAPNLEVAARFTSARGIQFRTHQPGRAHVRMAHHWPGGARCACCWRRRATPPPTPGRSPGDQPLWRRIGRHGRERQTRQSPDGGAPASAPIPVGELAELRRLQEEADIAEADHRKAEGGPVVTHSWPIWRPVTRGQPLRDPCDGVAAPGHCALG